MYIYILATRYAVIYDGLINGVVSGVSGVLGVLPGVLATCWMVGLSMTN